MGRRRHRGGGVQLDGLLPVDKPVTWTSHDVVNFVRSRYRLEKVGHGGTLDPMASGLLILLLGASTRQSESVMAGRKIYEGTYTLGVTTDSQDADGAAVSVRPVPEGLTLEQLTTLAADFTGDIEQIPPMVSAIKKQGVPLYKLAREGKVLPRDPRPVTVHAYCITGLRLPEVDVRVVCSKGTYVRTLAHDFGERLGCGAHLSALRRVGSGDFHIADAVSIDQLRAWDLEALRSRLEAHSP